MNEEQKADPWSFSLSGIIFVALMSALNVGINLIISPAIKLLLGHIVAGILIMIPIDLIFVSLSKYLVKKHWTSTFYMTIFGTLSIWTTMFGATPGPYKIIVGFVIGLFLDLAMIPKNDLIKIFSGGIIGAIMWWISLFTIWQLFNFPFVTGFSTMLMGNHENYAGFVDLSGFIQLPITTFNGDFFLFAVIVGLLSAIPCIIGIGIGFSLEKTIEKTAIYEKFHSMQ